MLAWLKRRKALLIFMGIVFVILSLLLLPAFARAPYEKALVGGEFFEKDVVIIFLSIFRI